MNPQPFRLVDLVLWLLVLAAGGGARAWYLIEWAEGGSQPGPWHVQDPSPPVDGGPESELHYLVENLNRSGLRDGFRGYHEPFRGGDAEVTAHVAPGYPVMVSLIQTLAPSAIPSNKLLFWGQAALGTLAAGFYFLLCRRAFGSLAVATLAGLFCALNPFWVINCAEFNDGTLATFLLAFALWSGVRLGGSGGALTSCCYGLALALLSLTRAALLPFAIVALLWFMLRSRTVRHGWLAALLAFLWFNIGLNPWLVRNYKEFGEIVPIVDTAWWHLWVGNNWTSTGGPYAREMKPSGEPSERPMGLPRERLTELQKLKGAQQPRRYGMLRKEVAEEVRIHPGRTLKRRLDAAGAFVVGEQSLSMNSPPAVAIGKQPGQARPNEAMIELMFAAFLLGALLFGFLGWRWSYPWRSASMPLQLAIFWIPLPYILSHAESLHGPRLPLDGPLLCLAAFALVALVPGVGGRLLRGEKESEEPAGSQTRPRA